MITKTDWLCISCGKSLGGIYGGEFYPAVPGEHIRTSGPNLVVTCPDCGHIKTFYTADPVVRALYQLVSAIADVTARAAVESAGRLVNRK